jgi:Uma2 family endonuclease
MILAMTAPAAHFPATYDDLRNAPDHVVAELIDGELHTSPRPRGSHGNAASSLLMLVGPPFHFGRGGPGGWWILSEPEIHFGPRVDQQVAVPDLAGWRRERMPELPTDHRFRVVPDWSCEVASPSTGRLDRVVKLPLYAKHGVGHGWVVDPEQRTLEVFRLEQGRWVVIATYSRDQRVQPEPFDAITLDLGDLWS